MMQQTQGHLIAAWARVQAYARAWRSPDRLLVIESDDWGSIRTSSSDAYRTLVSLGYPMHLSCWSVDALETDADLLALYDVLSDFRDGRGKPACVTANMVMGNPDFTAVRQSGFHQYECEPVASTLQRSPKRRGVTRLWKEGMQSKWFRPQFHAREHIRWRPWLRALRDGSAEALQTFDLQMCGVPRKVSKAGQSFYQPVYTTPRNGHDISHDVAAMVRKGIQAFEREFGFRSLSTIAPNCGWTDETERAWADNDVRYFQGGFLQYGGEGDHPRPHYLGQRTRYDGYYLVRNCTFEPAKDRRDDCWRRCLSEIARAFLFKTPAIVTSHRVNYVGSIDEANREWGLSQLRKLLESVTSRWADVQFLSSPELGYLIEHDLRRVSDLDGHEGDSFPTIAPSATAQPEINGRTQ